MEHHSGSEARGRRLGRALALLLIVVAAVAGLFVLGGEAERASEVPGAARADRSLEPGAAAEPLARAPPGREPAGASARAEPAEGAARAEGSSAEPRAAEVAAPAGARARVRGGPAAQPASLRGRVVDGAGRPIEGAQVTTSGQPAGPGGAVQRIELRRGPDGVARMERVGERSGPAAVSGVDGRFVLEGLRPELRYTIEVTPPAPYLPVRASAPLLGPGQVADAGDLVAPASASISGIVRDPAGAPLPGARVTLDTGHPFAMLLADEEGEAEPAPPARGAVRAAAVSGVRVGGGPGGLPFGDELPPSARTDAQGRFRLERVRPGEHTLIARKAGLRTGRASGVRVREGQETGDVELVLGEPLALVVAARDLDGRPIADARVEVAPALAGPARARRAQTDAAGEARIEGLSEPALRLTVTAAGAGQVSQEVRLRESGERVEVVLRPTAIVRGRVVQASDGAPARRGFVWAEPAAHGGRVELRADGEGRIEDGRFELASLAPGDYRLRVRVPGLAEATVPLSVPAEPRVIDLGEVRLAALGALEVTVTDPEGRPLEGAEVSAGAGLAGGMVAIAVTATREPEGEDGEAAPPAPLGGANGRTDAEGRARLSGLEPGPTTIRARLTGYGEGTARVSVPSDGSTLPVSVALPRPAAVEGVLLRADGQPAEAGVWLLLVREGAPGSAGDARTDAAGAFRFEGLGPGRYRVLAPQRTLADPEAWFEVGSGERVTRTLRLAAGFRLSGVVRTAEGAAVSGARVVFGRIDRFGAGDPEVRLATAEVTTDAAGRFALAGLSAEGEGHGLGVTAPGGARATFAVSPPGAGEELVRDCVLPPAAGASVQVWVHDAVSGEPAAGARVELSRADDGALLHRERTTGADGTATLPDVPPGRYVVRAELEGRARASAAVEVGGGAPVGAPPLTLGPEGRVALVVHAPGLATGPFPAVQLELRPQADPSDLRRLMVRPGEPLQVGGFLPGDTVRVRASAPGHAPAERTLIAGEPAEPTALELTPR